MNARERAKERAKRWTPWPVDPKKTIVHYEVQRHRKKRIQKKWTMRHGHRASYYGAYISAVDFGAGTVPFCSTGGSYSIALQLKEKRRP